ncbi:MAG: hypothetical protein JXA68_00195 [Ignavibacteriales bacterium]|nr:hypothetical protein [Ignavibacteriales bacterium]
METKARLFQYAVIYYPTKEEEKNGEKAKLIIEPTTVLAKNEAVASMIVVRQIPEEYAHKLENVEIAIRPF